MWVQNAFFPAVFFLSPASASYFDAMAQHWIVNAHPWHPPTKAGYLPLIASQ